MALKFCGWIRPDVTPQLYEFVHKPFLFVALIICILQKFFDNKVRERNL